MPETGRCKERNLYKTIIEKRKQSILTSTNFVPEATAGVAAAAATVGAAVAAAAVTVSSQPSSSAPRSLLRHVLVATGHGGEDLDAGRAHGELLVTHALATLPVSQAAPLATTT